MQISGHEYQLMEEEDRLKSENIQQANLIKELEEEEQAHRDLINVYEKQYKDNAEKIAEYEKYFVEVGILAFSSNSLHASSLLFI